MRRVNALLGTRYPIIQAGMVWVSGWRLASAVSNAGGLGVLGAGSMHPEILEEHLQKCQNATNNPFGVNIPLLYPEIDRLLERVLKHRVQVVITSAGSPRRYTQQLKSEGVTVLHVVSSAKFAIKAQDAGVDAVIAEGFEAGGHNGREETTTFTLIPIVREHIQVPLIAAGGIANGRGMFAAMALGADGVQVGSRFVASEESSAHSKFKKRVLEAKEGDTALTLKELTPVRLLKNKFYNDLQALYQNDPSAEALKALLGRARAKRGMFEGDMEEGELEIGQIAALIHKSLPAGQIIEEMVTEFRHVQDETYHFVV